MTYGVVQCCVQRLGGDNEVTSLDKDAKTVTLANGKMLQYDNLISTMPLDLTLQWLGKSDWAEELTHRCGRAVEGPLRSRLVSMWFCLTINLQDYTASTI